MEDTLTRLQIEEALRELPDWQLRLGGLVTVYKAPTSAEALELIADVGRIAEELDHHPDLDWRYNRVFVRFTSHDAGSVVTVRDVNAAAATSEAATAAGAVAQPGLYRTVELVVDSHAPEVVSEVWRQALGYRPGRSGGLEDPQGRGPGVWFRETSTPASNPVRMDVHRGGAESAAALEKLAPTGALTNRDHAPEWVVVTDSEGNRLCLCTGERPGPDA